MISQDIIFYSIFRRDITINVKQESAHKYSHVFEEYWMLVQRKRFSSIRVNYLYSLSLLLITTIFVFNHLDETQFVHLNVL